MNNAERARADLEAYRTQADIEIRERQRAEDALRESEARYRALAARTTRLYTLSAGLSEAVTLDAVAKVIVRQGKVVAGASAGSVTLLVDGAQFETLYAEQYPRQLVEAWHRFPAESGLRVTAAVETRRPVLIGSFVEWQLRTPLSAVLGWAAMLRSHKLDAAREARAIEVIHSNATRQAHLIDELLDVSRIVAGRATLDLQEVDLAENVRGAVETIMPLAEAKGLHVRIAPLPAVQVVADPHRLEQVFVNLLGNAVKFTAAGGHVMVDVVRSECSVDVRVEDTGRGIDAAFLPHVFERFRQAESTVARSVGGLGLGLFIARCLVDAHGGCIRVENEGENRGATFTVSLPTANGSSLTERATAEITRVQADGATDALPSLQGVRVPLVDDESDAREVMAKPITIGSAPKRQGTVVFAVIDCV